MPDDSLLFVLLAFGMFMLLGLFAAGMFFLLFRAWLRSFLYGAPVPLISIVAMRLRGNPPTLLLDAYITLRRAGEPATIGDVENAYIDCRNRILTSDDLVEQVRRRRKSDVPDSKH